MRRMLMRNESKALLVLLSTLLIDPSPARAQVDADDLRLGLIGIYRDVTKPTAMEIVQLDPHIALHLNKGDAPHPRLAASGGNYRWEGYLNVLRAGEYQFSVALRGKVRVLVGNKEVLSAENLADSSGVIEGASGRLESGFQPIVVEFTRAPGAARLQLFWKAPFFHKEPVPHQAFKHDPAKAPARLATDRQIERGRFLVEELSCAKCHQATGIDAVALDSRQGPDLTGVADRVFPGWIYRWLQDPQKVHPGAVMPRMFSATATGRAEAYAVTRFLMSLCKPSRPFPKVNEQVSAKRGERLFTTTGCIACHAEGKKDAAWTFVLPGRTFPLESLTNKTTAARLAIYLQDPLAVDPSGRMPKVPLDGQEIADLAAFLCSGEPDETARRLPAQPPNDEFGRIVERMDGHTRLALRELSDEKRWVELGRQVAIEKRCTSCHELLVNGKHLESKATSSTFADLRKSSLKTKGCVSVKSSEVTRWPRFALNAAEVDAVQSFVREGSTGANSPAPGHAARSALARFNCLACHARDGEGGLTTEVTEQLRRLEKAEFAEAVNPPPLTGVADKLQLDWLRKVLLQTGRARPWMGLRMPQFGKANVGKLAEHLCALEGVKAQNEISQVALTPAKIEAGRHLVGKSAFGCVTCHDLAGIPAAGTRGPDLASMNQRVRYDWYRRWMEQAQRMQPGTRMPTVFPDGVSTVTNVLGGNADAQAEAIWAYLSLGAGLPLPEGIGTPKGRVLAVRDRPTVLRTFMPDSGTKSIAVGYAGGVSAVFDAAACRLAYAWSGNFLDVSPVWDNRGGAAAKVLGSKFWTAPQGFPWAANASNDPPDFMKQRTDPERGAALAEGKTFTGDYHLFFNGYSTDKLGIPIFRYEFDGPQSRIRVEERPLPLRSSAGDGLARHFNIDKRAKQNLWLLVAESSRIGWLNREGHALDFMLTDRIELPTHHIATSGGSGRMILFVLKEVPSESRWVVRRLGSTSQLLLRLPADESPARVSLHIWSAYRDEPALVKEILSAR